MTTTWTGEADMGAFVRGVASFYAARIGTAVHRGTATLRV